MTHSSHYFMYLLQFKMSHCFTNASSKGLQNIHFKFRHHYVYIYLSHEAEHLDALCEFYSGPPALLLLTVCLSGINENSPKLTTPTHAVLLSHWQYSLGISPHYVSPFVHSQSPCYRAHLFTKVYRPCQDASHSSMSPFGL